jgi:transcriptional regulator with XRE-family HTH domain
MTCLVMEGDCLAWHAAARRRDCASTGSPVQGITQAQLAELLGVSQQTVQAYEVGRRRIQVSALPLVARALSISLEELLGEAKPAARSRRGPAPKWEQQIEAIAKLPRARQRFVSEMLDTVLAQH